MATTIRLTRMGRKQAPFYRVVVTDSRARRDGAYIESLGYYNPMPDAYELTVDMDRAMHWLSQGAEMSDTARSLLRKEGILLRWHLAKQGTDLAEIETKVEEFRNRRAAQSEAIKAESRKKFETWQKEQSDAAKKKAAAAQAAEDEVAAAAEKAAKEAAEAAAAKEAEAETDAAAQTPADDAEAPA